MAAVLPPSYRRSGPRALRGANSREPHATLTVDDALFAEEDPKAQDSKDAPKSLTGKTCYKDNEWLKGSNGIFEGIFGGGAEKDGRANLRPPSGPGIGGNFQRRIGQIG